MSGDPTGPMVETRNNTRTQDPTMESLQRMMAKMRTELMAEMRSELERLRSGEGTSTDVHVGARQSENQNRQFGRMSKMEFPRFNGDDVKGWIFRCRQFFCIDQVEDEMKVGIAAMHVHDKALVWHQHFVKDMVKTVLGKFMNNKS